MAKSRQNLVKDKICDMTECSICSEIFTSPKCLPCVHTFCLHCLETYGKDKQPGNQLACPICRSKFAIPDGGLCNLPSNFFIGKMVEIGKLSMGPVNEAMCNICPEGEEVLAKMYCIDCEQIICERCSKSHTKTKFTQNHKIVELGRKLNPHELNSRNSYCDHHPRELVKMYCYEDNVAICLICCVESHQSHRCVNIDKAAGEFTKILKEDLEKVTFRLQECEAVEKNLDEYKEEFKQEISRTEEAIYDTGIKLKRLIDQHTEILVQNLKFVTERNLKAAEITKQDVERFTVMIDSYSRYSDELLTQGSPVDICRAANQMHARANELEQLPSNCSGDCFRCDTVAFHPSSFENLLKQCKSNNAVGELTVSESQERTIKFGIETRPTGSTEEPIESAKQDQSSSVSSRMLDVSNIPSEMTKETLKIFLDAIFGDIESLDYNQEQSTAVVTVTASEAVDNLMIVRENLPYPGDQLCFARHVEKVGEIKHITKEKKDRSIFVSRIPRCMNEDLLLTTIERKGFSHGLTEGINFDPDKGTAVITFKNSRVAESLIGRGSLEFKGYTLMISRP